MKPTRFFTLVFLCLAANTGAQDLHFSQPYHNPMHFTPAQTGVFRGDLRAMGLYRSQWTSVPVSYRTFAGAFDMKAWQRGANTLGAGLLIQQDKAGDAGLSWLQIGFSGSATRALNDMNSLSVGFGVSVAQRRFDISGLKFKNQWTGDTYDASLPTKESFNESSGLSPTLSAGLNWRLEIPGTRTEANVGIGAFHLNRPAIGFDPDGSEQLPMRLAVLANTAVALNETYDLIVFAMGQRMRTAQEILFGAGGRLWLVPGQTALQFTLGMRLGDALIPTLQYEYGDWTIGLSYDWNRSDFEAATNGRGGFELAVVYRSLPVPPVKTFKSCPVF